MKTEPREQTPTGAHVGSEKKCELGECWRPAEYVDKFGILMCAECMEVVRAYTCGIVPLSPNDGTARSATAKAKCHSRLTPKLSRRRSTDED